MAQPFLKRYFHNHKKFSREHMVSALAGGTIGAGLISASMNVGASPQHWALIVGLVAAGYVAVQMLQKRLTAKGAHRPKQRAYAMALSGTVCGLMAGTMLAMPYLGLGTAHTWVMFTLLFFTWWLPPEVIELCLSKQEVEDKFTPEGLAGVQVSA